MPRDPFYGGGTFITPDSAATNAASNAVAAPAAAQTDSAATRAALSKLTGGQTLTPAESALLGIATTDTSAVNIEGPMFTPVDPNATGGSFIGPIPTGSTRTDTGYITAEGTAVDPMAPYKYDGTGTLVPNFTPASTAITTATTGMTADQIAAMLAQQAAQFQQQMATMQAQMQQQINDALKAQTAALEQQKKDAIAAQRKSAFEITKERFAQAGLKELGDEITAIYQGTGKDRFGKAFDEIPTTGEGFYLALINTKSYYDRFGKVNEDRLANGFKALDERTIVQMEDEYQTVLQAYKTPAGFYDSAQDYQMFLKNNYSKNDVASALQAAADVVASKDPNIRKQLSDYFGVDDGALTAYYADPAKGQKVLENITGKNMNTAAALLAGLSQEDATVGQQYGAGSYTYEQNRQRYSQAAKSIEQTGALAKIYGENFGAKEAIAAEFGDVQAQQQATRIRNTALAGFGGSSGVGTRALRTTGQVQ